MQNPSRLTYVTPFGEITYVPVGDAPGYSYQLTLNGVPQKSFWNFPSSALTRIAILRAAAKAANLPEFFYWELGLIPVPGCLLDFDGIHENSL